MKDGIDALKQRLNERTKFAKAGEQAVGLIEDVERSISGAGILKPTVEFIDGAVVLRVVVEPEDVITYENVAVEPKIIGLGWCRDDGVGVVEFATDCVMADWAYVEGDWSDAEVENCLTALKEGLGSADIAVSLNRELKDVAKMIESLRAEGDAEKVAEPDEKTAEAQTEPDQLKVAEDLEPEPEQPADPPAPPPAPPPAEERHGKRAVFTNSDVARMVKLWGQGNKGIRIAEIMKRETRQVTNFIQRNRAKFPIGTKSAKPARRVDTSRFTPALDLQLAQYMEAGDGIGTAAAIVRIPREICVARWNELVPKKTPEAIKALVKRLLDDRLTAAQ